MTSRRTESVTIPSAWTETPEEYLNASAWQIERIEEGLAAARDGRTLPADEVFPAIAAKHNWSR